ncbi:MAG TPA: aminotransferase class V-fold PLP-dependent enzyme [Pirellulales bacterium]|jgi:cysteine desulfurase/selenocysteine lyase|nr:aminotransferase class V-fold PLP-dependent enzyme [Pirellulales bacterium]
MADASSFCPWWDEFRAEMPIARNWAYFNHAAVAPLPFRTQQAITSFAEQATVDGDTRWQSWSRGVGRARTLATQMLGCDEAEVALVHSTTEGVTLVAEGFPWRAGDNIVTLENEFPSNQYPWMNLESRQVETRRVSTRDGRLDLAALEDACDARTRIVSVSWVGYLSGWRADLAEVLAVAKRKGALLFVDAIQGLGVFPLNVKEIPIDFLAADGHKWLLGPEGAGVFYLRREHLELLRPIGVGWHSVVHAADYGRIELNLRATAARYEGGTQNMVGFIGLASSLELLARYGPAKIGERVVAITDEACERLRAAGAQKLSPRESGHRSGIVSFELPGRDALEFKKRCLERGVVVSARSGRVRLAAHAYNSSDDIGRLIEAISG